MTGLDVRRAAAPAPAAGRAVRIGASLPVLVLALVCWVVGLRAVTPEQMDGSGVLGVLTWPTLLSYPLLVAAGALELRRPGGGRGAVLTAVTVAGVLMVFGLLPAIEDAARLPVPWVHAGFAEYIGEHGQVLAGFDTRFSWAAFFAAAAMLARAAGLAGPESLLTWAPLVLGGLAVLAMRALARAVFGPRRAAGWVATWLFLAANWTEQEYFSPQGVAMVLFLTALAVTVRYLVRPGIVQGGRVRLRDRPVVAATPRQRSWATVVVVLLAAGLAPTHQLTPYVLVSMLLVLLAFGRLRPAWLPVLCAVPVALWFVFGAQGFWSSQLARITDSVGRLDTSIRQGIGDRISGGGGGTGDAATGGAAVPAGVDAGHQFVVALRMGIAAALVVAALLGLVVLRRQGMRTWTLPALGAVAFLPAVLQPYGGEVFVRCFLYAVPWLAIGAAALVEVRGRRVDPTSSTGVPGPAVTVAGAVALSALLLGTVVARGGNDAYVGTTAADVASVRFVYDHAPGGATLVAPVWYSPMRSDRLEDLRQLAAVDLGAGCGGPDRMADCITGAEVEYVVVNPQQEAAGMILDGRAPGWLDGVVQDLERRGYEVAFSQDGAQVLARPGVPR